MLENILRKASIAIGIAMLVASIYLSYDGFDQSVSGGNPTYTILSAAIGITLAIAFSLVEFIVSSRTDGLNSTLRWLGLAAYIYSIYTNYIGLQHLLNMDMIMAGITAAAMDILPEQMIAWGLGEAVMHDLFGNLGKFAAAPMPKSGKGGGGGQNHQIHQNQNQSNQSRPQSRQGQPNQSNRPKHQGGGGGSGFDRRQQLERQFQATPSGGNSGKNGKSGSTLPPHLQALLDEIDEEDE